MPTQRLSMRRIKQLLTMRFSAGASTREIARELGVAPSTVREYLSRAAAAGIVWPLAADATDDSLTTLGLQPRQVGDPASVRVQAYYLTQPLTLRAIATAKRRGLNVEAILDKSQDRRASTRSHARHRRERCPFRPKRR